MKTQRIIATLILVLASTALSIHSAESAPSLGGQIVFESFRGNNWDIYSINVDGSNLKRLTDHRDWDRQPSWSPDGKKIAFESRMGYPDVYVMNADGSNKTAITPDRPLDNAPDWSPDGKKLVFFSSLSVDHYIVKIDVDGSNLTSLTNGDDSGFPDWSPDGKRIAFTRNRDGNWEVYVMGVDGSNKSRLTNDKAEDSYPVWSPDGKKIMFQSNRNGNYDIYVMNADGSRQTQLTNSSADDFCATWSPDGRHIAFTSSRDGKLDIYLMNADGSGQIRLINDDAVNSCPDWTPVSATQTFRVNETILEVTEVGTRLIARATPSQNAQQLDLLFVGDRVLWKGKRVNGYLEIYLSNGTQAYVTDDPRYVSEVTLSEMTTNLRVGVNIRITSDGDGMHLRTSPSVYARELSTLTTNQTLKVIGGPKEAEYYLWWQLRLSDGRTGWAVNVPKWWRVVN